MKFGRLAPRIDYRTLRFGKYAVDLPPPPVECDQLQNIYAKLGTSDVWSLFPMDGNDKIGDCTVAAAAHAITCYNGMINHKVIPDSEEVQKTYFQLTGGDDAGMMELDVLKYWQKVGICGEKILAYVKVNPRNHVHVKQAISLFGGVYIGFQVQQGAIEDFEKRNVWQWSYNLENSGHAVFVPAYDEMQITCLTWGSYQPGTWDWWDECCDEAWCILPLEAKDPAFTPGFNIAQLTLDLLAITG